MLTELVSQIKIIELPRPTIHRVVYYVYNLILSMRIFTRVKVLMYGKCK